MRKPTPQTWDAYRQHMLDETAHFIEWGLRHPELVIEIPTKPASEGGFPASVSDWFWGTVLTTHADSTIRRWRNILIHRHKQRP